MAWNEEVAIGPMLTSLLHQTLFRRLAARHERGEVVCVANGCTDRTVEVAETVLARMRREHPCREAIDARVIALAAPGKNQAWNRYVHEFSARDTRAMFFLDADIVLDRPDTLHRLWEALERNPVLGGATDFPIKRLAVAGRPSWRERLSLATSDMSATLPGRLHGMLYALRTEVARNLYLPRDLIANEDGFLKAAICTDFFRAPSDPGRVVSVAGASHLYVPYLQWSEVLKNQKRQMIGQTTVHVLVEHLQTLPEAARARLGETLRRLEAADPDWLKKLINAHLGRTRHFWRLFPGLLGFRWQRLAALRGRQRLTHLPAAVAGFVLTLAGCWQADRFLRRGVAHFWPQAARRAVPPSPAFGEQPSTASLP